MRSKKFLLLAIPVALLFAGCEKTTKLLDEDVRTVPIDPNAGFVKFIHAYAPLTPSLVGGTGGVHIYMDGTRLDGGGNTSTGGVVYNGTVAVPSGAYTIIPSGSHTFYFIQNRITSGQFAPVAGDTVFKKTANIEAGKYYSMFMADSSQNPGIFMTNDDLTLPAQGKYRIRFADLVYNPNDRYDVFADSIGAQVATNIGYREISNFVELAVPKSTENFTVKKTGTSTVVYTLGAFTPITTRIYTLYARGLNATTGRTPGLTFYTNR